MSSKAYSLPEENWSYTHTPTSARVIIVGCGIGGLTLAAFLERAGIQYQIFERAREVRPLGSALSMGSNVMYIFSSSASSRLSCAMQSPSRSRPATTRRERPPGLWITVLPRKLEDTCHTSLHARSCTTSCAVSCRHTRSAWARRSSLCSRTVRV
ncbi:MAG: hypothetical protein BYD32DRAFT_85946 [Podila humilis]|nr:MAG: hypothetical protein BYD32DRAFT_85946 [Podila humilis]